MAVNCQLAQPGELALRVPRRQATGLAVGQQKPEDSGVLLTRSLGTVASPVSSS